MELLVVSADGGSIDGVDKQCVDGLEDQGVDRGVVAVGSVDGIGVLTGLCIDGPSPGIFVSGADGIASECMGTDVGMDDTVASLCCLAVDIIMSGGGDECVGESERISIEQCGADGRQVVCRRIEDEYAIEAIHVSGRGAMVEVVFAGMCYGLPFDDDGIAGTEGYIIPW